MSEPAQFVYFIRAGRTGPIKIGTAKNPLSRMASMQTGNHEKLELIGWVAGDETIERKIFAEPKDFHIHGEWYKAAPSVLAFVRSSVASFRRDAKENLHARNEHMRNMGWKIRVENGGKNHRSKPQKSYAVTRP